MDNNSLLIGLVIVIISLIPLFLIRRNRKKKEKLIIQSIHDLAKNDKHTITQFECFRDFAIGIDTNDKYLFFSQVVNDHIENKAIDLNQFSKCENNTISTNMEGSKFIEKVQLQFINSKKAIIQSIELFDVEKHIQVRGELQLGQKWSDLVNKLV